MGRKTTKKNGKSTTVEADVRTNKANVTPLRAADTKKPQQTTPESKPDSPKRTAIPTHDQIADRAQVIWEKNGCQPGRDEQNWLEAEAQLKAEMAKS